MTGSKKQAGKRGVELIPGIGSKIAEYLSDIGILSIDDLKGQRAEEIYEKICDFKAAPVDRCLLYVLRCANYYVSHEDRDPELLKWWNWKD